MSLQLWFYPVLLVKSTKPTEEQFFVLQLHKMLSFMQESAFGQKLTVATIKIVEKYENRFSMRFRVPSAV